MTIYHADLILHGINADELYESLRSVISERTARFAIRQGGSGACQIVMDRTEQGDTSIKQAIDAIKALPSVVIAMESYQ